MRILKIFIICWFLSVSYSYAVNLPGMSDDDDETLKTYLKKVQSSEVENSRDYSGTRPASLNKKPWMSDDLGDMELLEWPDEGQHDYSGEDGRTDFRYYISDCMFSASYPSTLGPVTSTSNNGCYEIFYFYKIFWLKPGSIITKAEVKGPAKLAGYAPYGGKMIGNMFYLEAPGGGPTYTLYIFPNASYGSKVNLNVYTISDKDYQDRVYLDEINEKAGTWVSEADLRESRGDVIAYYVNKGCQANTLIHCAEVCKCLGITPTIDDDDVDDAIPSAGSAHVWVDSSGLACPPYTWTVSGKGWSIIDDDGDNITDNDLEQITLSLINTSGKSCGTDYSVYATVTVTDNCGVTDDIEFRYSGGKWVFIKNVLSNNACVSCGGGGCGSTACASFSQDIISGNEKWAYSCNSYTWWSCETKLTANCWNTWSGTNNPPCGTPYQCWITYWDSNPTDCCTTSKGPSTCNYMYYTWSCP